jgi:deferrochelatase/peroxidase EfeB
MPDLPFDQIQGFILRGYTHPRVRHFMINVPNAAAGRKFIGAVTPMITTATPWSVKPAQCCNIAFTADGLSALGIDVSNPGSGFSTEFVQGAIARGNSCVTPDYDLGDTGESAPANWILSLGTGRVHIIVSLFALDEGARDDGTSVINAMMKSAGVEPLGFHDSDDTLGDSRVHFGYHDSISQPNIDGAPPRNIKDNQPVVSTGEFVLGYNAENSVFRAGPLFDPANGTYSAFRILKQDVDAFYEYLAAAAAESDVPQEVIQAKLCGRWADGTPLVLSPDAPDPGVSLNNFDYSKDKPARSCPIASHIRRSQRRNEDTQAHRLLRRAAPYGPPYVPKDGVERGLIGHFICSSLQQQYEFIVSQWVNGSTVTAQARDPLIGAIDETHPPDFILYWKGEKKHLKSFDRFTTTRGGAYCYFPSIAGLKALSS